MTPDAASALAADLHAADYTTSGLARLWGPAADAAIRSGDPAPARRALRGSAASVAALARLLFLGDDIDRAELDAALPSLGAAGAVSLGLVRVDGSVARACLVVRPIVLSGRNGWIASDPDELAGVVPLPADHVLGVGGAGRTLVSLLPVAGRGRALDLGCGCGILAVELRTRGYDVVATDISPRALEITALNAALNGLDGIETRLGSLYDPVDDERFSLIVSNPPFVITPRTDSVARYEYRDGGLTGDALMAAVVGGLSAHLKPDGQARLLGNWEGSADRVRDWAPGLGLWAIERERLEAAAYARLWIRDGGTTPHTAEYGVSMDAWLDDFAARGVESIGMGWLVATAADRTLDRVERIVTPLPGSALGAHLQDALTMHAHLAAFDDAALAASVLRTAPDVTEARHHIPGMEDPAVIELRQGGGFGRVIEVDPALAALVGACDGDLPVGVLIDAIAELLEVDAAVLRADLLPRVRELLFTGFLSLP